MSEIITYPGQNHPSGFTNMQFKQIDALYCRAAAAKVLTYRTVECDFDEGVASYTYYQSESRAPFLRFVIRRVGPRATLYELYMQGKGRVVKTGLFSRAYERLAAEVEKLLI